MRFMLMVKADDRYEAGAPPAPELVQAIQALSQKLAATGKLVANGGLMPSAAGARVRASGGTVRETDGPFAETKELIGGFAIVDVGSKAEAVALAREFMAAHVRVLGPSYEGECEVRRMFEGNDCGATHEASAATTAG
jgi:hypothetical protein